VHTCWCFLSTHPPTRALVCRGVCNSQALTHALGLFTDARKHHSSTLNVLANALHKIFTVPVAASGAAAGGVGSMEARACLRDACFDYLASGGAKTRGPVGLLSAYVRQCRGEGGVRRWLCPGCAVLCLFCARGVRRSAVRCGAVRYLMCVLGFVCVHGVGFVCPYGAVRRCAALCFLCVHAVRCGAVRCCV
jgi:hypothetical protein